MTDAPDPLRSTAREALARAEAAMAGPWLTPEEAGDPYSPDCPLNHEGCAVWPWRSKQDMVFAYAARTDVPALANAVLSQADTIDELRAEVESLRELADFARLLGPARMVLDRCAERPGPAAQDEAADMAQRIVDLIGHPVTDEPPHALVELAELRAEVERLQRRIARMMADCGWCQESRSESGGFSPCPLHEGAEQGAIGKNAITGRLFAYCPNCTQRTGDDGAARWKAQAEVERLRAENERLRQSNPLTFRLASDYVRIELEDEDDEPCCDQNFGGSHYHCGRCNEVTSMMGHYVQFDKPGWMKRQCERLGLPFPFTGFTCDPDNALRRPDKSSWCVSCFLGEHKSCGGLYTEEDGTERECQCVHEDMP